MKKNTFTLFTLGILILSHLFLSVACHESSVNKIDKLSAALQSNLDELTALDGLPGATLGVVLSDGGTIHLASGFADMEKKIKMTPGDRMFSGSIGKTYVVPLILQLHAEGKLSLDDLAKKYFSADEWFAQLPNSQSVTIRMLLNHTSGIPEYVAQPALWEKVKKSPDMTWSPRERLSYIFGQPPLHPAGSAWSYADTNYIILGMIIEKITGNTYYHELQQKILGPYGLKHTTPANQRKLKGLIPGYSQLGEPFDMAGKVVGDDGRYFFNPQLEWTGGGLITTALELAQWAKKLYGGDVLPPAAMEQMLTGVETGENFTYGLGVFIWHSDFGVLYGHSGFVPGYHSVMVYVPKYKLAVALQFNCDKVPAVTGKTRYQLALGFIKIIIASLTGDSH